MAVMEVFLLFCGYKGFGQLKWYTFTNLHPFSKEPSHLQEPALRCLSVSTTVMLGARLMRMIFLKRGH